MSQSQQVLNLYILVKNKKSNHVLRSKLSIPLFPFIISWIRSFLSFFTNTGARLISEGPRELLLAFFAVFLLALAPIVGISKEFLEEYQLYIAVPLAILVRVLWSFFVSGNKKSKLTSKSTIKYRNENSH